MHSNAAEVQQHIRTYAMIGGALLVATAITVAVSYVHLGTAGNITLALVIATIKASLVAAIFMHLNHEKAWIYGSLVLTAVFFAAVLLLPVLAGSNTFGTHAAPWAMPAAAADHAGH
jgi:cytochrome c oxidase subunit 4